MRMSSHYIAYALLLSATVALTGCGPSASGGSADPQTVTLLNVSYDPTREFYQDFNASFIEHWQQKTGQRVVVEQSHGGSGKQARSVIDGLAADVVTLALAYDIDAIAEKGRLIDRGWQKRLPQNSAPYTSTIVFLVRKGNPKQIKDWDDLVREDVSVVTPNPKTSGGARWNYLAAWGYALKRELGDLKKVNDPAAKEAVGAASARAQEFVGKIFHRVAVLDTGARAATNTFVQREIGDVLLAWENEAYLSVKDLGQQRVEVVVPSISILAEPPVAVVDKLAEKHGTAEIARAYLEHLYSPEGQQLAAKHFYRPAVARSVPKELLEKFSDLELFTVDAVFGGWAKAQAEHFDDGGIFDKMYQPGK